MTTALNKTALKQHRDHLEMYERFLPSLDLKRQQLMAELQKARAVLAATAEENARSLESQSGLFALLGGSGQDLSGLVRVAQVVITRQNVLGTSLPVLGDVTFELAPYSMLSKPFWVDLLVELLQTVARLRLRLAIDRERADLLNEAVRRITQRVNLFEKVLIPEAKEAIQRIRIYLADAERTAVVRSKIAKARQHQGGSSRGAV